MREKIAVVADESSCSTSSPVDSQASQSSYTVDSSAYVPAMPAAAGAQPVLSIPQVQGSVFQYFSVPVSYVNYEEPPSVHGSLSSSSSVQSFGTDPSAQAEAMYRHSVDTTSNAQQPFNDDDLMYLASIFDKDEQHSNDNDLSSILSLNQETSVEDYFFGL